MILATLQAHRQCVEAGLSPDEAMQWLIKKYGIIALRWSQDDIDEMRNTVGRWLDEKARQKQQDREWSNAS